MKSLGRRTLVRAVAVGALVGILSGILPVCGWAQNPADLYANSQLDVAQQTLRQGNAREAGRIARQVLDLKGISGITKGRGLLLLAAALTSLQRPKDAITVLEIVQDMPDTTPEQKEQARQQLAIVELLVPK
jgi:hypothetical protein